MGKLIFLLFLPLWVFAQSSTGQEQEFDYGIKIETGAIQTVTNPVYPATMGTDGTIGRALAKDLPIDISPQPTNYTITDTKLGSHLGGIDKRLGEIGNTTAGLTNRIYFTAVPTTITAGTFYTSSATGKGAVAGVLQTVSNDDNVKNYFGQDVISIAQPSATTAPPGNYSGQLSVMVDNNSAQERFTVEIYKTNNAGTPIASGITGAPVGNLGVTVVAILDSGVTDLVASSVSNVSVSGNLASTLSLAVGERLRYHVSAQKVGTAGNAFMFSLFYGSDYNSYYDVTVTPKASTVVNDSGVTGGTVAEALNTLNTDKENVSNKSSSYTVSSTSIYPNAKALFDGLATKQPLTANLVTAGTGLTNYLAKYIGGSAIGNSLIYDNGSTVGVGTASPVFRFDISGGDSDGVRYKGTSGAEALLGVSSTNVQIGSTSNHAVQFLVNQMTRMTLTNTGLDLSGTPTAPTASPGSTGTQIANLDFVNNSITNNGTITTTTNITNATLTDNSLSQNGKTLYISNGDNNINYTVNGNITASFVRGGTGSITFVQGSGRTMVAANGTLVFNGAQYSTASVVSFGTTDIVYINNF